MSSDELLATVAVPASAAIEAAASTTAVAPSAARVMLSEALGYTVSLGSAMVKVPQLVKLLRSQSTVGLSLSMYSIELFSQSIAVFYHRANGFPLATYGENVSLGIGNMAILACFAKLHKDPRAIISLMFPVLLSPLQRFPSLLAFLQSLSIPLNIFSKLPQILINYHVAMVLMKQIAKARQQNEATLAALTAATTLASASNPSSPLPPASASASSSSATISPPTSIAEVTSSLTSNFSSPAPVPSSTSSSSTRDTSQLSSIPFALNFLGSFSRLYTTMTQLNGDRVMLVGFIISCILNGAIVLQCREINRLQQQLNIEREKANVLHAKDN